MKKQNNVIIGIYIIISPSGKIYIGQSTNIFERWNYYFKLNKYSIGPKMYNSLNKYGWQNHQPNVLEECLDKDLDELEAYYKTLFLMSTNWEWSQALFCQIRDGKGGKQSQETCNKKSESMKGYKPTEETKLKMKKPKKNKENYKGSTKETGSKISKANTGKKRTKEQNEKQSKIKKGKSKPEGFGEKLSPILKGKGVKKIIQKDLEGNFIKEWPSITEASKILKISIGGIGNCLIGISKTSGGFIFKYKEL